MVEQKPSILRLVVSYLFGILILFLLLYVSMQLTSVFDSALYAALVNFFSSTILLLVLIGLLAFIADLWMYLTFPANLPGPLFKTASAVLVVIFIVQLLYFMEGILQLSFMYALEPFILLAYVLTGGIVALVEYLKLMRSEKKSPIRSHSADDSDEDTEQTEEKTAPTWNDIGSEVRGTVYNISKRMRTATEAKSKKKSTKKR